MSAISGIHQGKKAQSSDEQIVDFAGNDYLGLARDRRLAEAMYRAACQYGISATSSRWALGWTDLHQQLEEELAAFFGAESACILGAAYFGGPVYYSATHTPGRIVYCDAISHSNQFMGMRAAGFQVQTFGHLDADDLESQISRHVGSPPVVATDGVFGISGEVAPLTELHNAASAAAAPLFVDDAHGVFVLGESGRGTAEIFGALPANVTILGSMSKAMGVNGGFLVGTEDLVERFRRSPAASGSAIPPPPIAAACLEALRIIRQESQLRSRMWDAAKRMRQTLQEVGISVVSDRTPILAMVFRDECEAVRASQHFSAHSLRIPHFRYASEPRYNLLRAAARACYTEEQLQRFEVAVNTLNVDAGPP